MQNIDIVNNIKKIHSNDDTQLDIITSKEKKIIIEAAAGSGKTKVLISSIAYKLATNCFSSNKKILALTFSVNAAYKIKKDLLEKLPKIIEKENFTDKGISQKITVTNYHGICRKILQLYGSKYLNLDKDFKEVKIISDNELNKNILLDLNEKNIIEQFNNSIKNCNFHVYYQLLNEYNQLMIDCINNCNSMTYNSIITLSIKILKENNSLRNQYQKLYECIIVDECQDTNILGYELLRQFINDENNLMFFGDSLQRIYGFIGAIPNVMDIFEREFKLIKKTMVRNYRFMDNRELLLLDKNIRLNAQHQEPLEVSNPYILHASNFKKEYEWILNKINELEDSYDSFTILVKSLNGNLNTEYLLHLLEQRNVSYFNALFTDDSIEYKNFHETVYKIFLEESFSKMKISKKVLEKCYFKVEKIYQNNSNQIYKSLLILLHHFIDSIDELSGTLKLEDIVYFMSDLLLNYGLKQYMNRIDEKIIVATIHSFKGLETDVAFIVDLEENVFHFWLECKECINSRDCHEFGGDDKKFLEELSVFYVAVTRARKQLFLTFSQTQITKIGEKKCNSSCFLKLNGIGYDNLVIY